jgi:phosphoheptose isomerase
MNERVKKIFESEASAIRAIPASESYSEVTEIIHKHVHGKNGKLITSGMGKAGQIAHNIATTFSSTGTPAIFLHPSEAQHGDLGILQENDILLVISNSGKTREIIELIDLKNKLYPAIPVVVITGNEESLWPCRLFHFHRFHLRCPWDLHQPPTTVFTDRRCPGCPYDGKDRIHSGRLFKETPRRISRVYIKRKVK